MLHVRARWRRRRRLCAGSGSIFEALTVGKPLVVVPNPRLMDNHQVELGDQLAAMGHLVGPVPPPHCPMHACMHACM